MASRLARALLLVLCVVAQPCCSRSLQPKAEASRRPAFDPAPDPQRGSGTAPPAQASSAPASGVAVVELFTSEGCSSCPPADRVLAKIAAQAQASGLPVFPLSFHVDYWNYLGWSDRFSRAEYSERQRGYASINPSSGTYTPEAVVNGEAECVGSDVSCLDSLVAAALKRPSRTRVELEARRSGAGIEVSYRVSGAVSGRSLNLALLEPHADSAVKSGENAGEHLQHVNVVRAFVSRPLNAGETGSWLVDPSPTLGTRRVGVIAFVEDDTQRDVSGASALELD